MKKITYKEFIKAIKKARKGEMVTLDEENTLVMYSPYELYISLCKKLSK